MTGIINGKTLMDYLGFLENCFKEWNRVLKDNSSVIAFTGRQYNRYIACLLDRYFKENRIIIWGRKRNFNTTRGRALASGYEPICYYSKGDSVFNNIKVKVESSRKEYNTGALKDGISLSDLWTDIPALPHNSKEKVDHPTQKPLRLMERCISICTKENDLILDPFMGSGSTGVACLTLNRKFIGIEKDKKYFDITSKRLKEPGLGF